MSYYYNRLHWTFACSGSSNIVNEISGRVRLSRIEKETYQESETCSIFCLSGCQLHRSIFPSNLYVMMLKAFEWTAIAWVWQHHELHITWAIDCIHTQSKISRLKYYHNFNQFNLYGEQCVSPKYHDVIEVIYIILHFFVNILVFFI